ncbi:MAG: type II secretion system F family protein, partial [Dehalococcoidia bacterium]|nr:type II secretion system F family protein [Dehalococcoidia bacterium]
ALMAMAERTGSDDVQAVARAIAQAERSGISIAQLLRARATEMRERRRLTAREQANKVPVKMTIPVVFFIFPTFFLLLLTPVALNAAEVMAQ